MAKEDQKSLPYNPFSVPGLIKLLKEKEKMEKEKLKKALQGSK